MFVDAIPSFSVFYFPPYLTNEVYLFIIYLQDRFYTLESSGPAKLPISSKLIFQAQTNFTFGLDFLVFNAYMHVFLQ